MAKDVHDSCRLARAAGRVEPCPGPPCPFWDAAEGSEGACVVDELALERTLELRRRPDLAGWLLELRGTLRPEP